MAVRGRARQAVERDFSSVIDSQKGERMFGPRVANQVHCAQASGRPALTECPLERARVGRPQKEALCHKKSGFGALRRVTS